MNQTWQGCTLSGGNFKLTLTDPRWPQLIKIGNPEMGNAGFFEVYTFAD